MNKLEKKPDPKPFDPSNIFDNISTLKERVHSLEKKPEPKPFDP